MTAWGAGLLGFSSSFGGALLGMATAGLIPRRHMSKESADTIKVAMAVVATLAALATGMLVNAAKNTYSVKDSELKQIAARIELIDRTMADYGPDAAVARVQLKDMVERGLAEIWDQTTRRISTDALVEGRGMAFVQHTLLQLDPKTDAQRWLRSTALQLGLDIEKARGDLIQQRDNQVRWPFLAILALWFGAIFLSFGLHAPRNAVVLTVFFVCALSLAAAFYLIVQMEQPYSGYLQISNAPLRDVLARLGR